MFKIKATVYRLLKISNYKIVIAQKFMNDIIGNERFHNLHYNKIIYRDNFKRMFIDIIALKSLPQSNGSCRT